MDGADHSALERQQLAIIDPSAHTFWHHVRFDLVQRTAEASGVDTVVDVGAGSGMLGDWLHQRHPSTSYRFQELSPVLDANLVARFGAGARHDLDAPIGDALVTLLDVIEHIDDVQTFLQDLGARMSPGGRLMVTVPAFQWAFSDWDVDLGHHRRYSKRTLRSALVEAGFVVDAAGYLFPEMLPLLPVRRIRRGGTGKGEADFPELSPLLNRIGYAVSSTTGRGWRWMPAGTSVVAVAHRPES